MVIRRLGIIRKCYECKKAFPNRTRDSPHDLIFMMKANRDDIPDGRGRDMVPRHASPIYIHLGIKFHRLTVPRQELEEIDMTSDIFSELAVGHIQQLQQSTGVYQYIIERPCTTSSNLI